MKKDKNAFIKILIILVIASLALLAIVYFMINNKNTSDNDLSKINISDINNENQEVGNNIVDENENIEEINNDFDSRGKLVVHQDIEVSDDHFFALCEGSVWALGEEKEYEYINKDAGIKFRYFNRFFSNDELIAEPYEIKKDEDGELELLVPYWPERIDSYPCHGGVGVFPRLTLVIIDDAIGFEEFDSKGEINGIEYLETTNPGLGDYDKIIKRVVLKDENAYIFSSSIIEERDIEGEDGEIIHIDGFDGEALLDYVFKNLEFLE